MCQFTRYFRRFIGNLFVKAALKYEKKIDPPKAALGLQRARGQKSKGLGILGGNNPKTLEVGAEVTAVETKRRTTSRRFFDARAAALYSIWRILVLPCSSVFWRILIVLIPSVFTPFPHISVHIVQFPPIRLFLSNCMRLSI